MNWWKWMCKNSTCKRTFVKPAGFVITLVCRYCSSDLGFDKVAEQKTKLG